jgi:hypothetical protein
MFTLCHIILKHKNPNQENKKYANVKRTKNFSSSFQKYSLLISKLSGKRKGG